jgi:HPt (histidine-containing phosphotransfer) domain-containing protein
VAAVAHRLAGAGGAYGFDAITREAKNLEKAVRAERPADIQRYLADLEAACMAARGRVEAQAK